MEAYGNAKTTRNNNSSRFGKHFNVQFSEFGALLGAHTTAYLLEKPRIIEHSPGERSYHVFYFLLKAPESVREPARLGGTSWEAFKLLSQKGTVALVDTVDDVAEFHAMHDALKDLGFSEADRNDMYQLLSLLMHLGNLSFKETGDGGSQVTDMSVLEKCAQLMVVDVAKLAEVLSTKHVAVGMELIEKPLDPQHAAAAR
jgi:myosin heavy subunit